MRVASWNVRGSNDSLKLQEIHDFLRVNNLDILGVLETKTKRRVPGTVLSQVFYITIVYASNDARERDLLWDQLLNIKPIVDSWLLLGDFNVVRDVSERISMSSPNLSDILDFNFCLLSCELEDLNGTGSASANFLASGISDHSLVVVTILDDVKNRTRFSFLNCLLEHPNYQSLVQEAWAIPVSGSSTFKLFASLKNFKNALKTLHGDHYSGITAKVEGFKQELQDCKLLLIETNIFQQKAKVNNITHGDCSSKFFVAKIQERTQQQIIGQITDRNGHLQLGLTNVANSFVDYYEHLLGMSTDVMPLDVSYIQQGPCVNSDDAADLVLPISSDEIRSDLFDIGSDKSLGPDGLSSAFFKNSWDLVKDSFYRAVQSFFHHWDNE
ncbi:uncharacterized protein LOC141620224 [Silene latifolia]|uniref:uncharacterized protein LOC141620224 n=1 Tax=Silene latifolia TaxID=37657 RepID=UPI003D78ABDD